MNNIIKSAGVMILVILATGALFHQVNWMQLFNVENNQKNIESKLGELCWESLQNEYQQTLITDSTIISPVDSLLTAICKSNKIDRSKIHLHLIGGGTVNAFTLPDNHIVIYGELIKNVDNQNQLAGVMAHELAHVELHHVMRKLIEEMGLSALINLTTGGSNKVMIGTATKLLSSSAYNRKLEKEADLKAVDYLRATNIDPKSLATFLFELAEVGKNSNIISSWISSHPEGEVRAKYILDYCKSDSATYKNVITTSTWEKLQLKIRE